MSDNLEPNPLANADREPLPKKLTFQEQLLTTTELTPELRERLSPEMAEFANKIFDLRRKLVKAGTKLSRKSYFTDELTSIWQSPYVQQDHELKDFYANLYLVEKNHKMIANLGSHDKIQASGKFREQDDLYKSLFSSWLGIEGYIKQYEIPQDSLDRFDIHLLTIGTFNNFGEGAWGNRVKEHPFDVAKVPPRDEVVAKVTNAHRPQYQFKGDDPFGLQVTFDPGREPEFIDQFQSKEKRATIVAQSNHGDIIHIAPSPDSPQFKKFAPLFRRLGADNVQIHGMIEDVIGEHDERKIRLASPLFVLLCDLSGREREYLTEEDRTFGIDDISIIHRDSAKEFIARETKGKSHKGQVVSFRALDADARERDISMRVEGYFSGFLQGTIVDDDPLINGSRTARSINICSLAQGE